MMRTSSETAFLKLALPAGVMVLRFAILVLVVISMIEALDTITGIIHDIRQKNDLILFGVLMAVLMPAGSVLFWGCKAVFMPLKKPSWFIYRCLQNYRDKKSPMLRGAPPKWQSAASSADRRKATSDEPGNP
jgi:hypothetical protein